MGQREIMRARWAKEDPEFLKLIEEEKAKLEIGSNQWKKEKAGTRCDCG